MKYLALVLLSSALILSGCMPEGEGRDKWVTPNPLRGPAGGEVQDQTAPVAPAGRGVNGSTASVFPDTAPPTGEAPPQGEEAGVG